MDCSFALSKDLGMEKLGTWNKKFMQLKKIFNLREILRGARWSDSSFAAQERISSPATCDTVVGLVMLQFSCIAKNSSYQSHVDLGVSAKTVMYVCSFAPSEEGMEKERK
jgi:hypothetical protein